MSKNPANRYQSAAEMRNDLMRALAGQRVEATPVMNDDDKTTILTGTAAGYGYRDDEDWGDEDDEARRKKKRLIILLSALGVLLIGGIVAAILLLGGDEPTPRVQMPNVIGQEQAAAVQAIEDAGLAVGEITQQPSSAEEAGRVLSTDPGANERVAEGSEVNLVIGAGPDTLTVPPVINLQEDEARAAIEQAGFTGNINSRPVDSLEDEGTVVEVNPAQGSQANPDTDFTLGISTGTIELPDVTNQTEEQARATLTGEGFSANQIQTEPVERDDVAPGTVVGTSPGPGSQVGADDTITLQVAAAPETVAVPRVLGQTEAQARATLQALGLTNVTVETIAPEVGDTEGTAVGTDPTEGTEVAPETPITLFVIGPPPDAGD
jgi:serine/threonine-protein kinase